MKVTFIQAKLRYPDITYGMLIPRYGLLLVATLASKAGHDVRVLLEDIKPLDWGRILDSDVVCFNVLTCTRGRVEEIAKKVREKQPSIPIVVGGTHATYFPENTLEVADFVVRQEGDETIVELLECIEKGKGFGKVRGVSYKKKGKVVHNHDRPPAKGFEEIPDFSLIDGLKQYTRNKPPWDKTYYSVIQGSRGCPFSCAFCPVKKMFGKGYRTRSIDSIIADIKGKLRYGRQFMFVDNNFAGNPARTKRLLRRIIAENLGLRLFVFLRAEAARDEELLALLKKAGTRIVFIGFESLSDKTLGFLNKRQNLQSIEEAARKIRGYGLQILGSFVVGSDADTAEDVGAIPPFLKRNNVLHHIMFPLWGCYLENGRRIYPLHRAIFLDWDHMHGQFVYFFPKRMKPSTLQKEMRNATREMYNARQLIKALLKGDLFAAGEIAWFWRNSRKAAREIESYTKFLEEIEAPYYDENDQLLEEKLKQRADLKELEKTFA